MLLKHFICDRDVVGRWLVDGLVDDVSTGILQPPVNVFLSPQTEWYNISHSAEKLKSIKENQDDCVSSAFRSLKECLWINKEENWFTYG